MAITTALNPTIYNFLKIGIGVNGFCYQLTTRFSSHISSSFPLLLFNFPQLTLNIFNNYSQYLSNCSIMNFFLSLSISI